MTIRKQFDAVPAGLFSGLTQSRPLLSLVLFVPMVCPLPYAVAQQAIEIAGHGQIQGLKWHDINGNGQKDLGEPGLAGWMISLNTGQRVATDANGHYSFIGLTPGDYIVTEESRPDWVQTYPGEFGQNNYTQIWTAIFGGNEGAEVQCTNIEIDIFGNRYISGTFSGLVDFDASGAQDIYSGLDSIFVTKIQADNAYAWTKTFVGSRVSSRVSCATTSSGEMVAIGHDNTIDLWKASGDVQVWQKRFDGRATIGGLCFDPNDNLFIAGAYEDSVDFDPGSEEDIHVAERYALNCMFLTRLNSDDSYAWTKVTTVEAFSASALVRVRRIRSDSTGAILVGGSFEGRIYFDPGPHPTELIPGKGDSDAFLAKYTNDGEYLWANTLANAEENRGYDLCIDPNDEIVFVGAYSQTIHDRFSQRVLPKTSANIGAGFVVKYSSMGTLIWAHGFGETDYFTAATGLAVTPTGDVLVAVERMPWVADETSTVDLFVQLLDGTTRELLWEQRYASITTTADTWIGPADTEHNPSVWGVAVNGQGDLFVGGRFQGLLPGLVHNAHPDAFMGNQNGFVSKFELAFAGHRLSVSEGTAWIGVNFGDVNTHAPVF